MKRALSSLVLSIAVAIGVSAAGANPAPVVVAGPNWCC